MKNDTLPWRQTPAMAWFLAYVGGLLAWQQGWQVPLWAGLGGGAALLGMALVPWAHRLKGLWLRGLAVIGLVFLAGQWVADLNDLKRDGDWFGHRLEEASHLRVRLLEEPVKGKSTWKAHAAVTHVQPKERNAFSAANGKVLLYFSDKGRGGQLGYGDVLYLAADKIKEVAPPAHPFQFDYRQYLAWRNVYHQAYLPPGGYLHRGENEGRYIYSAAFSLRNTLSGYLRQVCLHHETYTVAQALLLGDRSHLAEHSRAQFARIGVLHLLAVSGLHVAIVYLLFRVVLAPLRRLRNGRRWFALGFLVFIWSYALLTGFSPSVSRAAVMLSIVVTGEAIFRKGGVFHALLLSAVFLLTVNPALLFHAGFQLSYLAVFGLVWLQRPIYGLLPRLPGLLDRVWELGSVSIAAQLATVPLSLLLFGQFPLWFLPANIVLVPVAALVLYSGAAFLAVRSFGETVLSDMVGWLFHELLLAMQHWIKMFALLPGGAWDNAGIGLGPCLLVYLLLYSLGIGIPQRNKAWLKVAGMAALGGVLLHASERWHLHHDERLIAGFDGKHPYVQWKQPGRMVSFVSIGADHETYRHFVLVPTQQHYLLGKNQVEHQALPPVGTGKHTPADSRCYRLDLPHGNTVLLPGRHSFPDDFQVQADSNTIVLWTSVARGKYYTAWQALAKSSGGKWLDRSMRASINIPIKKKPHEPIYTHRSH